MSTSAKAVGRAVLAAAAVLAIMLTPTATGVSQARGGMRASRGGLRSSGSLGARRGALGVPGTGAAARGVRVRATANGITVRSGASGGRHEGHHEGDEEHEGHLFPPVTFVAFPFQSVVFPFSSAFFPFQSFFSGAVFSPIIPGTIVNPLLPGTIFVPLFPTNVVSTTFPFNTFLPVFPSTFVNPLFTPFSTAAVGFGFAPSIVPPLLSPVVPPLLPQFIVLPVQMPLVSGPVHEAHEGENGEPEPDLRAVQTQTQKAGGKGAGSVRVAAQSAPPTRSAVVMRVTSIGQPPEARALQEWVRTQNTEAGAAPVELEATAQPAADGSTSPRVRQVKSEGGSAVVQSAFGRPTHAVTFVPRTAFFDDFFTTRDGRLGFTQFRHRPAVTAKCYYSHYVNDPSWFAFDHPSAYPSAYALWGWTPPWVSADRVSVMPANGLGGDFYPDDEQPMDDADLAGAARCVEGIRSAWLTGDPQRLAPYLSREQDVRVYFNGKYEYSAPAADYYAMTVDAFSATRTTVLALEFPLWFSTGDVVVTGRAAFRDPDGNQKTVYVSYKMRRLGDGWRITDFGSSLEPTSADGREFAS